MTPKISNLITLLFALFFGIALTIDISDLINSRLNKNPSNVIESPATKPIYMRADRIHEESSAMHNKNESNTKFSVTNEAEIAKPVYPKPTIKLLVFKKHQDRQLNKMPVSVTFA